MIRIVSLVVFIGLLGCQFPKEQDRQELILNGLYKDSLNELVLFSDSTFVLRVDHRFSYGNWKKESSIEYVLFSLSNSSIRDVNTISTGWIELSHTKVLVKPKSSEIVLDLEERGGSIILKQSDTQSPRIIELKSHYDATYGN